MMTGEFELIRKLIDGWSSAEDIRVGPGDDASAVIWPLADENLILQTTDLLVEGIHFRKGWGTPYQLGWKSLAVNLSDIAAMGGRPLHTHLSLAIPENWTEAEILEFMGGYRSLAEQYGVSLLGGDLSRSDRDFVISASVNGTVPSRSVIGRGGAEPGEVVWVSGSLGSAAAGLAFLREDSVDVCPGELLIAFLKPQPEVELGLICSESGRVKALIDISDGLAGDLGHILQASGVGATLREEALPIEKSLREVARRKGWNPNDLVLQGGEDYRLLGCTAESHFEAFNTVVKERLARTLHPIGHIENQPGLRLQCADGKCETLAPKGHDHFI